VARKNRLSGTLKLSVSLRADGSIETISIRQSSGHPELDEAAARIVRLAAPYARFPDEFRAQTDLLVITRTWRFFDDFRLQAIP
jgi:protein TonB